MLEFVSIFTKGGINLWSYISGDPQLFATSINNLIRKVILEERNTETNDFEDNSLLLRYKLDNELDLIYVCAYQKIINVPYLDKLITNLHHKFKQKYHNDLLSKKFLDTTYDFNDDFLKALVLAENCEKIQSKSVKQMRSFNESAKSKKNVASMITSNNDSNKPVIKKVNIVTDLEGSADKKTSVCQEQLIQENRKKLKEKLMGKKSPPEGKNTTKDNEKNKKKPRIWELGGNSKDVSSLDRSKDQPEDIKYDQLQNEMVGSMKGSIQDIEIDTYLDELENSEKEENSTKSGILSIFKGIVGSKKLEKSDLQPVLDKLRDHLIAKNVAAEISLKLCESVATKLEGKILGTFDSVSSLVKNDLTSSLVQILTPKKRIDIIRDVLEAKKENRPYVLIFCGVNGVGKSTNLAKITFWLIENNFNVLIAACDTFRAGAVEQLRTHTRHLNALHPAASHNGKTMVQLYEKGYGKDAAGIAMEAIKYAKDSSIDVVLVDTAGRMQDNEPLMRSLAKLIKMNDPDLVLFVGEALVGNEAVDQLVKFNQALADYSSSENPHKIDGIVLTKFDTIDDKVGAAISMTYVTGKPIVFVGTGQTYADLKSINAKAIVHSLMK